MSADIVDFQTYVSNLPVASSRPIPYPTFQTLHITEDPTSATNHSINYTFYHLIGQTFDHVSYDLGWFTIFRGTDYRVTANMFVDPIDEHDTNFIRLYDDAEPNNDELSVAIALALDYLNLEIDCLPSTFIISGHALVTNNGSRDPNHNPEQLCFTNFS